MGRPVTGGRRFAEHFRVTSQTWTAAAASLCFLILMSALVLLPVPYVMYSPGSTYDILEPDENGMPTVGVSGVATYPVTGELHMTTVAVTRSSSHLTLPQVIHGHLSPARDVLPRDSIYQEGVSAAEVQAEDREMMDTSQQSAIIAALQAADQPVTEQPVVASVVTGAPADGVVEPGDFILAVDGQPVDQPDQVPPLVQAHPVGEEVQLTVQRSTEDGADPAPGRDPGAAAEPFDVTVAVEEGPEGQPRIGADVEMGYQYDAEVNFGVREGIGGPSAGLIFALGIYDQITPGDLTHGRRIAGTGGIDMDGTVEPIGGIRQKIHASEDSGVDTFLVPAGNCPGVADMRTSLDLVRVDTLDTAIAALQPGAELPRC